MAATIEVRPGQRWTAASWLFDWVLSHVASEVGDAELAGHLRGIVGENLGFLSLSEVTEAQRSQSMDAAAELPTAAAKEWHDFEGRDQALDLLRAFKVGIG
ncbi:hypothetical protein [Nocardioides sp.]|uniref:hypothetical protein n=1 Tax=Nocardioides sp. TaxID=35761 RepID=UPI002F41E269